MSTRGKPAVSCMDALLFFFDLQYYITNSDIFFTESRRGVTKMSNTGYRKILSSVSGIFCPFSRRAVLTNRCF